MNAANELDLATFAQSVAPSGAVTRLPQVGQGQDVLIYHTYMNGPLVDSLPEKAREFEFPDVLLHRLTEKLGLDPTNPRDNLKVAEVVAVRAAYMETVLHATTHVRDGERWQVTDAVLNEYEALTNGLSHPWIVEQIEEQRARSQKLGPVLQQASKALGATVDDAVPQEFNKGSIVSQNTEFTVQNLGEGKVAVHDNKKLSSIPEIGDDVIITYYRGQGQVFENTQNIEFSAPFLEPKNNDLAILAKDKETGKEQLVIFNGITSFSSFVKAQELEESLIEQGMDVLATKPKPSEKERPVKMPASDVTIDEKSGALSMDYTESGIRYTVLFADSEDMAKLANEFGMSKDHIEVARRLERQNALLGASHAGQVEKSLRAAEIEAKRSFDSVLHANEKNGRYAGKIVGETECHVIQDAGRRTAILHDKTRLDKVPGVGQHLSIGYGEGRGVVVDRNSRSGQSR